MFFLENAKTLVRLNDAERKIKGMAQTIRFKWVI